MQFAKTKKSEYICDVKFILSIYRRQRAFVPDVVPAVPETTILPEITTTTLQVASTSTTAEPTTIEDVKTKTVAATTMKAVTTTDVETDTTELPEEENEIVSES